MPHISITLYKGRDKDFLEKIAKTLQDSLCDTWTPDALSVSVKEVDPSEFAEYTETKIKDGNLIIASDYIK